MKLRSERIITPAGTVAGEVSIAGGRIDAVVRAGDGAQCNSPDPDELAAVARFHARDGTTALLATTVSAAVDELCSALQAIGLIAGCNREPLDGAQVLGAHLEGPFLSRRRPGAMDPETFLEPTAGLSSGCLRPVRARCG